MTAKKTSYLNTALPPPANFIPRPDEFKQLLVPLLDRSRPRTVAITTALQGGGGFGKTTLAQAVCHHGRVRTAFPDGILWLSLGQAPRLIELLNNQIRLFEDGQPFGDINAATARLRDLLAGRRVLIVLDDVWQEAHASPFMQRSPGCAHLITTRRQDLVSRLDGQPVDVNEMTTAQAAELLASGLAERPAELGPLRSLAAQLGEWPLLLNLAAGQLKELVQLDQLPLAEALAELGEALAEEGFTAFDRADEGQRNRAIGLSLNLSLERLGPWREPYLNLAVFPEDVDIPFVALGRLWPDLKPRQVRNAIRAMQRLSLFNRYDPQQQTVRLRDVIRHYLIEQQENLPALQARFLNAYRPLLRGPDEERTAGQWTDLPADEPYLWDYLAYHLTEAGLTEELYSTVTDLRYLAAKSYARTTHGAEADLLLAQTQAPEKGLLRTLTHHFANATHLLNRCDKLADLQATLHSRLAYVEELNKLSRQFAPALKPPYLALTQGPPDRPHPALVRTLVGHTRIVYGCAYSLDGGRIVSASDDHTLKVWDAQTGQTHLTLKGHTREVLGCIFSPDGGRIVSASGDKTLKVWDAQTGQCQLTLVGHTDEVSGCIFSPDGGRIVSASGDKTLKVWDAQTGQCQLTLQGHAHYVSGCAYSPSGGHIVSASRDKTLKVWDAQTGQCQLTLEGHTDEVSGCAFSPDTPEGTGGGYIVSASFDGTLRVWDAQTGQSQLTLKGHTDWVRGCAYSPDGRHVLSASSDNTLKVWDVQTGQTQLTLTGHAGTVYGCVYSPDGGRIVSASFDGTLRVWDAQTGQSQLTLKGHTDWVRGCAYSPDGGRTVSASGDNTLRVWDAQTGQSRLILAGHTATVSGCAYSLDGEHIVSASRDKTLKVWDAQTGQCQLTLAGHTGTVSGCAYSPDGGHIISASWDKTLRVWDAQTGGSQLTLEGHTDYVFGCVYSPDGGHIVSASRDRTLRMWNAQTGQTHLTLQGHTHYVSGCAFSPDGGRIVSASEDKTLKVWDAQTGQCLATLAVEGALYDCAWSPDPDGEHLVAVGRGGVYFLRFVQ